MTTETKQWIFCLLTLVLSATTSVLVLWKLHHFFNTEVVEIEGMLPGFLIVTAVASVPWAYLLDFVFRLFENRK